MRKRYLLLAAFIIGLAGIRLVFGGDAPVADTEAVSLTRQQFRAIETACRDFIPLAKMRGKGLNRIEDYKIVYSENTKFSYIYIAPIQKEINGGDVKYTISKTDYSIQTKSRYK